MSDATTTANAQVQVDDDVVRVTKWSFAPGTATGWHTHEYDYVVVPVEAGTLTYELPDGQTASMPLVVGESYARKAGVKHDVRNEADSSFAFVEIELKGSHAAN